MNRSKHATLVETLLNSLTLIAMGGFLFTASIQEAQAEDQNSARKTWTKARDEWANEIDVQCAQAAHGKVKDPQRCAAARENLVKTERTMTELGLTPNALDTGSQNASDREAEASNDPKVLHKYIQELKAKNRALKAQAASQSCSAASQSVSSIKKSSGLGHSRLGEQDDSDADTVNFSSRAKGHSAQ
ncbi:MAG: hypothetical protein ACJ763_17540 [Bdellovibrionia bacterium]